MALDQLWAVTACALLAALAVFQGALIAGAPIGHLAWGGQHRILPCKLRISSAVSIPVYALFGYIALARADSPRSWSAAASRQWPSGCWRSTSRSVSS